MPPSRLEDIANGIAFCVAPGRRPAVIAFVTRLARTSTGKLQRLANPRIELSDAERRMVVLDARTHDAQGVPVVVRISPEPDTLAAKYAQESKDKLDHSNGEDHEAYDSMGILRQMSQCQVLEARVVSNMYVIGVVGLTLFHLYTTRNSLMHLTEDMKAASASLWHNRWHMNLFFVGAGYLDSKYNQLLGWRDVAMYLMVPGIPIICGLLPSTVERFSLGCGHRQGVFFVAC